MGALQRLDVAGHLLPLQPAEPDELLVQAPVLRRVVDLGVPVAHVPDQRLGLGRDVRDLGRPHRVVHRLVGEQRVVAIHVVLHHHLPVAEHPLLHPARRQLELAGRGKRQQPVNRSPGVTEMTRQGDALGRQRGEDEAAVTLLPGRAFTRPRAARISGYCSPYPSRIGTLDRAPSLLNVQPWYGQRNDVVFPFSALQPVAAVGTAVGQDPDHAVLAAYHHHGFGRDALGHVVAWLGDFALVGHEHPALAEDALHLQAEHLREVYTLPCTPSSRTSAWTSPGRRPASCSVTVMVRTLLSVAPRGGR